MLYLLKQIREKSNVPDEDDITLTNFKGDLLRTFKYGMLLLHIIIYKRIYIPTFRFNKITFISRKKSKHIMNKLFIKCCEINCW